MARINEKSGDKIYHIDMTDKSLDYLHDLIIDVLLPEIEENKYIELTIENLKESNTPKSILDSFEVPDFIKERIAEYHWLELGASYAIRQNTDAIRKSLEPLEQVFKKFGVRYEIANSNIVRLLRYNSFGENQLSSGVRARKITSWGIARNINKKKNIESSPVNVDNSSVNETFDALNGILTSCFNNNNEAAEAFSLRVSNALDYYSNLKAMPLPTKAPESYENRQNKAENAVDFLNRVWGNYIKSGVIFRDELNSLDSKLIQAVRNYCFTKPDLDVDAILPKDPYYRYLNVISVSHPDSQEFAEATIKIAERLKKNRQKSQNIKNAK